MFRRVILAVAIGLCSVLGFFGCGIGLTNLTPHDGLCASNLCGQWPYVLRYHWNKLKVPWVYPLTSVWLRELAKYHPFRRFLLEVRPHEQVTNISPYVYIDGAPYEMKRVIDDNDSLWMYELDTPITHTYKYYFRVGYTLPSGGGQVQNLGSEQNPFKVSNAPGWNNAVWFIPGENMAATHGETAFVLRRDETQKTIWISNQLESGATVKIGKIYFVNPCIIIDKNRPIKLRAPDNKYFRIIRHVPGGQPVVHGEYKRAFSIQWIPKIGFYNNRGCVKIILHGPIPLIGPYPDCTGNACSRHIYLKGRESP